MSDHRDHSRSGSEPGTGPSAEARHFWEEYARRTRPANPRGEQEGTGNGRRASSHKHECLEWCPICRGADVLRASAPPELREQLGNVQREALVTLRALLDAYIERIDGGPRRRSTAVEDIPIE